MRITYGNGFAVAEPMCERVEKLESAMLSQEQVDCPVQHHFAPGIYAREINIPKGTVLIGAVHRTDNLVIVSKGRLQIVTDDGTREVQAGDTLMVRAGVKNAAVALEDCRWTNILHNPGNVTDTSKLVEMFAFATEAELLGGSDNKQLAAHRAALEGETPCRLEQ
jgi:quercetin dioxygenase-like cupin family protein